MNLREKQNIFKLLLEGLRLVNRAGTVLFVYIIIALALNSLPWWLPHFNISPILIKLFNVLASSFLVVLLWRVLAAKADNFGESFSNSLSASVIPCFYLLLFNLLLGVACVLVILILLPMLKYLQNAGQILVSLLAFFVSVRLCFAIPAIALRAQGPVKAIIYSWEMTRGIKAFFKTMFVLLVCTALPVLCSLGILRALYVIIPLHFADSFNLAALTPGWYAVGAGCFFIIMAVGCWAFATFLLFFLNCDYGENRDSFTPEAQTQITSQTTQVFGEDNNVLPPGVGKIVTPQEAAQIQVTKASVKTIADENEMQQHLEQVYQPQANDVVQYTEEDRMPTILFDDEMAKQIEENRKMWTKKEEDKTSKNEEGNEGQSIKMSK